MVDVFLGDGNDSLDHDGYGAVDAGEGDDDIRVTNGIFDLIGGAGADRLDATGPPRPTCPTSGTRQVSAFG